MLGTKKRGRPPIDHTGRRFGTWTVLARCPTPDEYRRGEFVPWICECSCGALKKFTPPQMKAKYTIGCDSCDDNVVPKAAAEAPKTVDKSALLKPKSTIEVPLDIVQRLQAGMSAALAQAFQVSA